MLSRKAYPTDLTDSEWQYLQPLIPAGKNAQGGRGRKRQVEMREVLNAIFYLIDSGCKWKQLPHDLPATSTVFSYFSKWQKKGIWQKMNDTLRAQVREAEGRNAQPSLGVIDSQSVKVKKGVMKRVTMVIKRLEAEKDTSLSIV